MKLDNTSKPQIYLFGSCIYCDQFNDIDLLIVYNNKDVLPENVYHLCKPILDKLQESFKNPLHVLILHNEEVIEHDFINEVNACYISPIDCDITIIVDLIKKAANNSKKIWKAKKPFQMGIVV